MGLDYNWGGVDYGAKLSGYTVICYVEDNLLHFLQVDKKVDADKWLQKWITELQLSTIYIDAPLSLPQAYYGLGDDYFYRECDKLTSAMSPMFLGGLTARAMKLKSQLSDVQVIETYPGYLAKKILSLSDSYLKKKKYTGEVLNLIKPLLPVELASEPDNWHQLDALLCWISGYRDSQQKAVTLGEEKEGLIIV